MEFISVVHSWYSHSYAVSTLNSTANVTSLASLTLSRKTHCTPKN